MARPSLHNFKGDLANKPGDGSDAPPRTIRASNLDDNFRKVTLLDGEGDPPLYEITYTKDGTRITRFLPDGSKPGDLLYWNGKRWVVLTAPASDDLRVLTIQNGALAWTQTEDCEA